MKVLVVDDEKLALEGTCSAILEARPDSEIKAFRDSEEALLESEKWFPQVAFLDIEMRTDNGISLAEKLKKQNPQINIIFVTGYDEYMKDAFALFASGYVLKPVMSEHIKKEFENLRFPVSEKKRILVHTFGTFEILVDGKPLKFAYSKSKELLAILVDGKGLPCSLGKIEDILWENDFSDKSSYLRNLVADIRKTLKACNCEEILIHKYNELAIDRSLIDCDYFDFLEGKSQALSAFNSEYMSQYSWAENTLGFLLRKKENN
ncbi:MAG: response regulator [Treponema sp.]|nr:response regulator [Treponema sp.]